MPLLRSFAAQTAAAFLRGSWTRMLSLVASWVPPACWLRKYLNLRELIPATAP